MDPDPVCPEGLNPDLPERLRKGVGQLVFGQGLSVRSELRELPSWVMAGQFEVNREDVNTHPILLLTHL